MKEAIVSWIKEIFRAKREEKKKLLFYLRIYTYLITLEYTLNKLFYKRYLHTLKLLKNLLRNVEEDEEYYSEKLIEILKGTFKIPCKNCKLEKCIGCEKVSNIKTRIKMAQNIVLLRLINF